MSDIFQLKESEQRFRALFENNPDLVLFQDAAGVLFDANPACLHMFGKSSEEVLGRSFSGFLQKPLRELFAQKLREAFAGRKVQFDVEVQLVSSAQPLMFSVTKDSAGSGGGRDRGARGVPRHNAGVGLARRNSGASPEAQHHF